MRTELPAQSSPPGQFLGRWALCLFGRTEVWVVVVGSFSHPQGCLKEAKSLSVCTCFLCPYGKMAQPLAAASALSLIRRLCRRAIGQNHLVCCILGCCGGGTWHPADASKILR